ncbi:TUBD1 [Bugula neritina]|uniref:TUBD1 n=1 Tax=Bugula neritina TaxID=10212 RepID=A0A7J7K1M0_BUGNE|nr:TUBD1 [Bugula neritina]
MPFITVQLGQCGNQLGTAFFNSLMNDTFGKDGSSQTSLDQYQKDLLDRFFIRNEAKGGKSSYTPRSVLIDMESKVILQSLATARQCSHWQYSNKQYFSQKAGSGNNWAHGYCVHGKECDAAIDDLIRTQVEDCDR